jgi:N-acetylmuramoyl-L-alanine amidase
MPGPDSSPQRERKLTIRELPSPNCNDRKDGMAPTYLILHYTVLDGAETEAHFMNPKPDAWGGPVSAHYVVDVDGTITRMVPEDRRAWHAGESCWDGLEDFNSRSIGIEIVNPGHPRGYRPFPVQQMRSVVDLCRDIMKRNGIPAKNVLGHSDIAPGRKIDPGELFDWPLLAATGVGVWPKPEPDDYAQSASWVNDGAALHQALVDAGYDGRQKTGTLVEAFQRHYQPEKFKGRGENAGIADAETAARLRCLIRLRHS